MNDIHVEPPSEPHTPDEIAVALAHRDLVIEYLNRLGVGSAVAERGESNETLGLGLIKLQAVQQIAGKFEQDWGSAIPISPQPAQARNDLSDTNKILDGLRLAIGDDFFGWYPRMGKVRSADVVGGLPHTGAGWEYPRDVKQEGEFLRPAGSPEGKGVVIGVIDAPIHPHPELKDRWYPRPVSFPSWTASANFPWLRGHSTFVAGRILDRAPGADLMVRGVLEGDLPRTTVWTVATAMARALDEDKVDVLNLSLGCYTEDGQPPFVLARAVEVLSRRGVPVIAAAGNHGQGISGHAPDDPIFPAACPGAIAVGAFKKADPYPRASMSPAGPWITLGAPGEDVESTYFEGPVGFCQLKDLPDPPPPTGIFSGYATWGGTSFAAATVSGEIARLMTAYRVSAEGALEILRDTDPRANNGIGSYR